MQQVLFSKCNGFWSDEAGWVSNILEASDYTEKPVLIKDENTKLMDKSKFITITKDDLVNRLFTVISNAGKEAVKSSFNIVSHYSTLDYTDDKKWVLADFEVNSFKDHPFDYILEQFKSKLGAALTPELIVLSNEFLGSLYITDDYSYAFDHICVQ